MEENGEDVTSMGKDLFLHSTKPQESLEVIRNCCYSGLSLDFGVECTHSAKNQVNVIFNSELLVYHFSGKVAYISTDGSYIDSVPVPNSGALVASSQGSSSATKSRRHAAWTDEETRAFIQVWGEDAVQSALVSNYRTVAQYQWISDEMRARGYNRDWEQCRQRAKVMRRGFKMITDGNSHIGQGRHVWPYYKELSRFLCIKRNLVLPRLSGNSTTPPVDDLHREHRESLDAPYDLSVGKSDKGTLEEPDVDYLLLPESAGSQQSDPNVENQVASPAGNSDLSMDGSVGPGTPMDPLLPSDSVSGF